MEFRFRAGDRRPRRPSSSSARLSRPRDGHDFAARAGPFHGGPRPPPPPPPSLEWEAAARRERIIREEVERRLIEEEVCRELAIARARLHGGFGPGPFDGPFLPPPPGPFFGPDGPFTPPTPPPPMPVGMHPNWPPPASCGPWDGFEPRRRVGFGHRMLLGEARRRPLPPPKPKHKLELREIEPSESSEVLSSETKVSGVKRKRDVIAATTEPKKVREAARDWSCALCQISATSQAGLNEHLEGKKHKAKLVQCGAIKVIDDDKIGLQASTGNKNGAGPSDAPKKIHILVDEAMHEVVQKSNYMWCERCRVRCNDNAAMAVHLRGKKHNLLNKVWRSIKSVRMNNKSKEDSATTCDRKLNESSPIGIPEEDTKEGTYMATELCDNGPSEIPVEMKKETTDMDEEVNENGHIEISVGIKKEDTDSQSEVNKNGPVEIPVDFEQEDFGMAMDVNKNGTHEIPAEIKNESTGMAREANGNSSIELSTEISREATDDATG